MSYLELIIYIQLNIFYKKISTCKNISNLFIEDIFGRPHLFYKVLI